MSNTSADQATPVVSETKTLAEPIAENAEATKRNDAPEFDLTATAPGRDAWLYITDPKETWTDQETTRNGRRRCVMRVSNETGNLCWWKADKDHFEAFTEKVCADLAQIVEVAIPAGAISHWEDGEIAFLSKQPSRKVLPLRQVRGDKTVDPLDPMRLRGLAPKYQSETVPFDLWVDNWDKHEANLILLRTEGELNSIDYGWVFGLGYGTAAKWVGRGFENCVRPEEAPRELRVPKPSFVFVSDLNWEAMDAMADKISQLSTDVIEYVCRRAASAYSVSAIDEFADETIEGLVFRRKKVKEWLAKRLQ